MECKNRHCEGLSNGITSNLLYSSTGGQYGRLRNRNFFIIRLHCVTENLFWHSLACAYSVSRTINDHTFEVKYDSISTRHTVDMEKGSCSCVTAQQEIIPCRHKCAVLLYHNGKSIPISEHWLVLKNSFHLAYLTCKTKAVSLFKMRF